MGFFFLVVVCPFFLARVAGTVRVEVRRRVARFLAGAATGIRIDSGRVGAGGEIVTDEPRCFEDLLDIAVKHLEDDIKVFAAARGRRDNQIEDTIQVHFA